MKKFLLPLFFATNLFVSHSMLAQNAPAKQWDRTFGGGDIDWGTTVKQTSDGGYIIGGYSKSDTYGDKSQQSRGGYDYWVIKTDANGSKLWDKTFGGNKDDNLSKLLQTSDGGYILGGSSFSGLGGEKNQPNRGIGNFATSDFWIVKLDANGYRLWDKTFGGDHNDYLNVLIQTADGGYLLGGSSSSLLSGDKSQPLISALGPDCWLVKVDANGNKQWDKTFGGSASEAIYDIIQTPDGGYIIGATSNSGVSKDISQLGNGEFDFWIFKIDSNGIKQWDRIYGSNGDDFFYTLKQTPDGGLILGGESRSNLGGDKSEANKGGLNWGVYSSDFWILKTDANGNKLWDKTIGGSNGDNFRSLKQTPDGGFILAGESDSGINGDKTQVSQGSVDFWLVKVDANGSKIWDKTIGGNSYEYFQAFERTSDGGYILCGLTNSGQGGDKTQVSKGFEDFWVVKLKAEVLGIDEPLQSDFKIFPNPTTGKFNLQLEEQQPCQITVQNALGQQVIEKFLDRVDQEGKVYLDLTNQPKGIYTVQLILENQAITKKVVLQ